jgi:dolichol-phosphate mannosyltransferase
MKTYTKEEGMLVVTNYNQMGEIKEFLRRCQIYYPKAQTVIVDDGSSDGSREYAEAEGFQVLRHEKNMGTGAAIRSGVQHAISQGYKWVVLSSSNGKIRPEDYATVYTPILTGEADYVTGSRFLEGGNSPGLTNFRRWAIPVFSLMTYPLIGRRFSDITCGFRAYTLDFFNDQRFDINQSWLNRYEYEYYVHYWACKVGLRIKEVPVTIAYSHLGKGRISKIKPFSGWWSMIRPLLFLRLGIKH